MMSSGDLGVMEKVVRVIRAWLGGQENQRDALVFAARHFGSESKAEE